ncbi:MAG: hypothetical protein KTR24_15835 [Saprospiraceae bacterium]|nr:hypothetical protein [Saprospiraceae bacterium]
MDRRTLWALGFIAAFLQCSTGWAQTEGLRIGEWRSYLPFNKGLSVAQTPDAIFYGTEWALMRIDKADRSLQYITKVDGLNDIEVEKIAYNETNETLIVAYKNSNIDLILSDGVVNLDQIKRNSQIVQDRTIFDISTSGSSAYFATGFGLVQLDLDRQEFGFTTFTSTPARSVEVYNGYLYLSTDEGFFRASIDDQSNLADFGIWENLNGKYGLPNFDFPAKLSALNGTLYAGYNDEIYEFTGDQFSVRHRIPDHTLAYAVAVDEGILTGWICIDGCRDRKYIITDTGFPQEIKYPCSTKSLDAVVDEEGTIWFADENKGFHYAAGLREPCQTINPNQPSTHNVSDLAVSDRKLYIATGGVTINYGYIFRSDGMLTNETGDWTALNRFNQSDLEERNMRDFLTVEAAADGTIYIGTFWDGLIAYKDGEVLQVFDKDNSSLMNSIVNPDRNRITDIQFDNQENMWVLNHDAPRPLSVRTKEGEWANFDVPTTKNLESLTIDASNNLWIAVGGVGILVYHYGEDPLSASDDDTRLINSANSELKSNVVHDLATDSNGAVWVGTALGPVLFDCGSQALASTCQGIRLTVESNGIPGELLGAENVKAIAVDGGNRKWFGTTNGIFVQNSSGETEVMPPLNADNSPLFDNNIIDIEIDPLDGEVFIASNKGVQSIRGEAIEGGRFHQEQVDIFPNPVRPNYAGPIAIKGLAENANVKITDIQGKIVYEGRAVGGQAIWYGEDLDGTPAASGVYTVFSTAVENIFNPDGAVGKIIMIR